MAAPYQTGKARSTVVAADVAALRIVTSDTFEDGCEAVVFNGGSLLRFYWSSAETTADDGTGFVKPDDVSGAGRWVDPVSQDVLVTTSQVAGNRQRIRANSNGGQLTITVSSALGFECWIMAVGLANTLTIEPSSGTIQKPDGTFVASLTIAFLADRYFFRGNGTDVELWSYTHLA